MATAVKSSSTNKITAGCYSSSESLDCTNTALQVVHKISFDR